MSSGCNPEFVNNLRERLAKMNASPEVKTIFENLLKARSYVTNTQIDGMIEGIKSTEFTKENQDRLNQLTAKVVGAQKEADIRSVLTKDERKEMYILIAKKAFNESGTKLEEIQDNVIVVNSLERLQKQLEIAQNNGDERSVALIEKYIAKVKNAEARSVINQNSYERALKLRQELQESRVLIRILQETSLTAGKKGARRSQLLADKKEKEKTIRRLEKNLVTEKDEDGKRGEIRRKLKKARQERKSIVERINKLEREMESEPSPVNSMLMEERKRQRRIERIFNKSDIRQSDLLVSMAINSRRYSSPQTIYKAIQQAENQIDWTSKTLDQLIKRNKERDIDGITIGEAFVLFGENITKANMNSKEQETFNVSQAKAIMAKFTDILRNESIFNANRIATFDISTSQKLREEVLFRASSNSIFDMKMDSIFVPSRTREEARRIASERGWQTGVVPQEHRFETPAEAVRAIQELLGRIRTLWLVDGFSGLVPLEVIEGIYQQAISSGVAKFSSRNPLIDFENAIVLADPEDKPLLDAQESKVIFNNIMIALGLTQDQIDLMPEMQDPELWVRNKNDIVVLDIETTTDADRNIVAVGLFKKGEDARSAIRFGATVDGKRSMISPEQARAILNELEELQNGGFKVVTFNGNGFDIPTILQEAVKGLEENSIEIDNLKRMAMRIALRSIDMMHSVASQHSRAKSPNLANLAKAAQDHKQEADKRLKSEEVKGTDIAILWSEANDGNQDSNSKMVDYISRDLEATLATFDSLVERFENGVQTTIDFRNSPSETFAAIPLTQSVFTAMAFKHATLSSSIDNVLREFNNGITEDAINILKTNSITGVSSESKILFDLSELENIVTQWLYRAMLLDPETKEAMSIMLDNARQEIVETKLPSADRAENTALEMLEGLRKVQQDQFKENGQRFILGYREDGSPRLTEESNQENEWIEAAVEAFNLALSDSKRSLEKIGKKAGFRKMKANENPSKYIRELMEYFVKRFNPEAVNGLIDLANTNVDYIPAENAGYGIFQIINGHNGVSGVRYKFDSTKDGVYSEDEGLVENQIRRQEARPVRESLTLAEPDRTRVPWFSPLGLAAITKAWDDYRMRRRIHHILTSNLSIDQVKKMFERIKKEQREINPKDVLYGKYTPRYYAAPPTNNRALYSVIPSLDMWREQTMEALFDIPTMLYSMTHDGFTTKTDTIRFIPDELGEDSLRAFQAMFLSSGLPTGSVTLEGVAAVIGHAAAFPITIDTVMDSINRGRRISIPTETLDSVTTVKYDANFSGAHMMAATIIQWSNPNQRTSILGRIKRELGIDLVNLEADGDEGARIRRENDLYERTMYRTLDVVEAAIRRGDTRLLERNNLDVQNLQLLKNFLLNALQEGELRDIIKGAVIPRLYEGGHKAVLEGLANKLDGLNKSLDPSVLRTFKDVLLSREVAKMFSNALDISATLVEANILDQSIGISQEDKKRVWDFIVGQIKSTEKRDPIRTLETMAMNNYFEKDIQEHQKNILNVLHRRIRKIAESSVPMIDPKDSRPREDRVRDRVQQLIAKYNERIKRAFEYLNSKDVGGRITSDEHYHNINKILSEDSIETIDPETGKTVIKNVAYTSNTRLAALNVHNRVPRRINEAELNAAIESQGLDIWATNEDGSMPDHMGLLGQDVFTAFATDSVTGRIYPTNGRGTNYLGPTLSKNLWEFGDRMLTVDGMTNEEIRDFVDIMIARDIMIRTAHMATPEIGDYDPSLENAESFFRMFRERSDVVDSMWKTNLAKEQILEMSDDPNDKEIMKNRRKAGGRIADMRRRLLDPNRKPNSPITETFKAANFIYGPAGFRPMFASMAFNEVGSMSLIASALKMRKAEALASFGIEDPNADLTNMDPNEVIPSRGAGYASQFQADDIPFVPEQRVSIGSLFAFGDEGNRLTQKTIKLKQTLTQFARDTGLTSLINDGNWVRLYLLHRAENEGLNPYFKKIREIGNKSHHELELNTAKVEFLFDMFSIIQVQYDAAHITTDLTELGQQMGFNPDELKNKDGNPLTYIQLFSLLWERGIRSLSSLNQGLTDQMNLYAYGSPQGLENQSETGIAPAIGMGGEVASMLALTLYSEVGVKIANEYVKINKLPIKGTFKQGNKTFVSLGDIQKYANETNQPNIVDDVVNLMLESPEFRDRVANTLNLYLTISPTGSAHYAKNTDSVDQIENDPTAKDLPTYMFGNSILRKMASDPNTRIVFTPEMLNQMLLMIKNFGTFLNAENAVLANMAVGTEVSVAQEMVGYQRQAFYEMQRQNIMDEYDMLNMLHMESSNPELRSIENAKMRQITGVPLVLVDGNYHIHKQVTDGLTVSKDMWTLSLRRAIVQLERRGSKILERPEIKVLENAISKATSDNKMGIFEVKAGVILSNIHTTDNLVRMQALKSYFGNTLTEKEYRAVLNKGIEIAETLHTAYTKPTESMNPFFYSAQALVERSVFSNDESSYQTLMDDPKMNLILGVETDADRLLASRAIHAALRFPHAVDLPNAPRDQMQFTNEILSLMNHETFQGEYPEIAAQIQELVSNDLITEETAEFYRGLVGAILKRNPEMGKYLSFAMDENLDRAGKFVKIGGTYQIRFGKGLKKRSSADQIRILAHEMTHLARALYLETDGDAYRELVAIFKSNSGRESMRMMLGIMREGMNEGFEDEVNYYMSNVEEFLAEWGSYLVINEFFVKTGVLQNYEMQNEGVNKATSFWRRAFNRIKRIFGSIMVGFDTMRTENPEIYNRMRNILDSMFSFTATEETRIISNLDQEFDMGVMRDLNTSPWKTKDEETQALLVARKIKVIMDSSTNKEFDIASLSSDRDNKKLFRKTLLGLSEWEYLVTIDELKQGKRDIDWESLRTPTEQKAVVEYILRQVSEIRGLRMDDRETVAGKLRSLFSDADLLREGSDYNLLESRRKAEMLVDILVNKGTLGMIGLVDNQINNTWNSTIPSIVALSFLLDHTSGVVDGSFRSFDQLPDINSAARFKKMIVQHFELQWTAVNNKHRDRAGTVNQAATRMILGDNRTRSSFSELSEDEFRSAVLLAESYRYAATPFIEMSFAEGLKSPKSEVHPSGWAFVVERDMMGSTDKKVQDKVRAAIDGLYTIQRQKLENNLNLSGNIDIPSLVGSGILPVILRNEASNNQPVLEWLKNVRSILAAEGEGSNDPRVQFYLMWDKVAADEWAKSNPSINRDNWNNGANETSLVFYVKAINKIIREANSGRLTWKQIMPSDSSRMNVQALFDKIQSTLNPLDTTVVAENMSRNSDLLKRNSTGRPRQTKPYPYINKDTPVGYHIQMLMDAAGNTAYLPVNSTISLTIDDVFLNNTEESRAARTIFSHDTRQVLRGIGSSIGLQAASRNVVRGFSGVRGLDFKKITHIIRTHLENQVSYFGADGAKAGIDSIQQKKIIQAIMDSLSILDRKYDVIGGVAEKFDSSRMSSFGESVINGFGNATALAWGQNLNLASLTTEVPQALITSLLSGTGTFSAMGDTLMAFISQLNSLLRPLSRLETDNVLRTTAYALFDLDHSARTEGIETDIVDNKGGKISKGWRWYRRATQIMGMSVKQATMMTAARYAANNLGTLLRIREDVLKLKPPMTLEKAKEIIQKNKANITPLMLRTMAESNFFGGKNLEILIKLMKEVGRTNRDLPDIEGMKAFVLHATKIEKTESIEIDGDSYSQFEALGAINALIDFQTKYSNLSMVQSNPMDAPTEEHWFKWLSSIYRTYPLLFGTQFVFRDSARLPTTHLVVRGITLMFQDLFYNLMLAWLGGWFSYETLENLWKQDKEAFVKTLFAYAARNPVFGRGSSDLMMLLSNVVGTGKAYPPGGVLETALNTEPLGIAASEGLIRSGTRAAKELMKTDAYGNWNPNIENAWWELYRRSGATMRATLQALGLVNPPSKGKSGRQITNGYPISPFDASERFINKYSGNDIAAEQLNELFPFLSETIERRNQERPLRKPAPQMPIESQLMLRRMLEDREKQFKATQTPPTPQSPAQGNTVAPTQPQVPTPPRGGSRAATPATPPTF